MRFFLFVLSFICFTFPTLAQDTYQITYEKYSHQKKIADNNPIEVLANSNQTIIGTKNSFSLPKTYPNEVTYYTTLEPKNFYSIIQLDSINTLKTIDSTLFNKIEIKKLNDSKRILGMKTKHARAIINSNTIDIWYVDNMNIKAAPNPVGLNLGLVLEYTRNNDYTIKAARIENIKNIAPTTLYQQAIHLPNVDQLTYKDLVWKSKFQTIPLLKEQQINFDSNTQFQEDESHFRFANGTVIVRKIKIPFIKEGAQIFIDLNEISNGDAYDRIGSVFLIPTKKEISFLDALKNGINVLPIYENGNNKRYQGVVLTEQFEPIIELMRFFTPFGINKYNSIQLKNHNWHESIPYRQDISEFRNILSDQEVYIGFFIGNYDKGGHIINSNITIHDSSKQLIKNNKELSLFNTTNVMEMAGQEYPTMFNNDKGIFVEFELNEDWKNAKLRFITTGHGGWENGDEFIPKVNTVLLDNNNVFSLAPWRQDCGSYRLYNPASGNFDNGISSSDYSRSNWCPGTVTTPYIINLGDLKAGKHNIQVKIPQGNPEGGSFSSWAISGILLGQ